MTIYLFLSLPLWVWHCLCLCVYCLYFSAYNMVNYLVKLVDRLILAYQFNARRCLFMFVAVVISFSVCSSSFVDRSFLARSFSVSICIARRAHRFRFILCACLLLIFLCRAFEKLKRISPRFALAPSHHSLFISFFWFHLAISRFVRVEVFVMCASVCVCIWEALSINVGFVKYFELFNSNAAVECYLFYENTSTRSDQTAARQKTRLRTQIKKKYRDFFCSLLIRIKHESLSCSIDLLLLYAIVN